MKRLLIVVGLTALAGMAQAQDQGRQVTRLVAPFNVAATKLPPKFWGHSPAEANLSLKEKVSAKGKYESTSEHQARITASLAEPLFGSVYIKSPLAFSSNPAWCDYDADRQVFRAHFIFGVARDIHFDLAGPKGIGALTQAYRTSDRTYDAQNAFGAMTTVRSTTDQAYGFAIMNFDEFAFIPISSDDYRGVYRATFVINIAPTAAKRLEWNIRAAFVGYLTPPYTMQDGRMQVATFDVPYNFFSDYDYVCLRLKSIWFYDDGTGFVYGKQGPKPQPTATPTATPAPPPAPLPFSILPLLPFGISPLPKPEKAEP